MKQIPATLDLALLFPVDQGQKGACTRISDIGRWSVYPSKWLAVHTIIRANMERGCGEGKGNKAARRLRSWSLILKLEKLG